MKPLPNFFLFCLLTFWSLAAQAQGPGHSVVPAAGMRGASIPVTKPIRIDENEAEPWCDLSVDPAGPLENPRWIADVSTGIVEVYEASPQKQRSEGEAYWRKRALGLCRAFIRENYPGDVLVDKSDHFLALHHDCGSPEGSVNDFFFGGAPSGYSGRMVATCKVLEGNRQFHGREKIAQLMCDRLRACGDRPGISPGNANWLTAKNKYYGCVAD